jgi:hypothetical protein
MEEKYSKECIHETLSSAKKRGGFDMSRFFHNQNRKDFLKNKREHVNISVSC